MGGQKMMCFFLLLMNVSPVSPLTHFALLTLHCAAWLNCHTTASLLSLSDLSDTDRSNLLHHYLQMHLPRTTHTPTARHGPNSTTNSRPDVPVALPLLPHLVVATAPMTDCSRADICLAELVNSLQRQQKQQQARRKAVPLSFTAKSTAFFATAAQGQDTGSSKQSALQSKHISSTHKQQYHHLRDFLSPASLLRELYDDIVAERRAVALASDMPGKHKTAVHSKLSAPFT